jgi:hypothetical protein
LRVGLCVAVLNLFAKITGAILASAIVVYDVTQIAASELEDIF